MEWWKEISLIVLISFIYWKGISPVVLISFIYMFISFILEKLKRWKGNDNRNLAILEQVYMRPEVNSNWFEISNRFEKLFCSHGDLTAATCK